MYKDKIFTWDGGQSYSFVRVCVATSFYEEEYTMKKMTAQMEGKSKNHLPTYMVNLIGTLQ